MTRFKRGTKFRSILCPVDLSEQSRTALRYAEAIVRRANGRLSVLYVNDPLLVAAAAVALHDRTFARRSGAELRRFVNSTVSADIRKTGPINDIVRTGNPAKEIAKAARRLRSDLIVMGTHGLTGANKLLIGSTTQGVLQQAVVPVLAIPDRASGETLRSSFWRSWPGERIVAAVELDERGEREANRAAQVARWFGSRLFLLHVVAKLKAPPWLQPKIGAHDRARIARARSRLEALARRIGPHVRVSTRVVLGNAAEEIAGLATTERAGLVITALRAKEGWLAAGRGSISYDVVTHAPMPVLALPG